MEDITKDELYDNKFAVINKKRLKELDDVNNELGSHKANIMLLNAIKEWADAYENDTGKELDQEYLVVNQDEPYADEVWQLIKDNED